MNGQKLLQCEDYDPDKFINWMLEAFGCRNDAALARKLETAPPLISKIRYRRLAIGDRILVKASDYTGMSTLAIRVHMFRDEVAR